MENKKSFVDALEEVLFEHGALDVRALDMQTVIKKRYEGPSKKGAYSSYYIVDTTGKVSLFVSIKFNNKKVTRNKETGQYKSVPVWHIGTSKDSNSKEVLRKLLYNIDKHKIKGVVLHAHEGRIDIQVDNYVDQYTTLFITGMQQKIQKVLIHFQA